MLIISLCLSTMEFRTLVKTQRTSPSHPERKLTDSVLIHSKKFIDKIKMMRQKVERMFGTISSSKRDAFDKLDRAIGRLDLGTGGSKELEQAISENPDAEEKEGSTDDSSANDQSGRRLRYRRLM